MSKVYILGAGSSKNYSQSTTEVKGLEPPQDSDFFQMAKRVVIAQGGDYMFYGYNLEHFLKDLAKLYGYTELPEEPIDIFDDRRLSMERVLTFFDIRKDLFEKPLFIRGHKAAVPSVSSNRISTMTRLIVETIAESLRGPVCEKHLKLAKCMNSGDFVLNFNYDLLMENALRKAGKFTDQGYRISFTNVFDGNDWSSPQLESSTVHLLKLHGSMNWIRCSYCGSNFLLRHQKLEDWTISSSYNADCPKCNSDQTFWERRIIPPLLAKNYRDIDINYLWREAKKDLSKAEELIIIGYSLPTTDLASEALLREGLREHVNEIPVTIVNPDENVKNRFTSIFPENKIDFQDSPDDFFNGI